MWGKIPRKDRSTALDYIPARMGLLIGMGSFPREVLAQRLPDAPLPSGYMERRRSAGALARTPHLYDVSQTSTGPADVPRGALGKPRFLDLHPPHATDGTAISSGVVAWTLWHSRSP